MEITTMAYSIKSRIWIESEKGVLLGEGRVRLLKAIIEEGSLNKAAKSLELSYKKAWRLLEELNASAEKPVVITSTGGSGGGGTEVTAYGKKLITAFDIINQNCWTYLDQQLQEHHID